MILLLIPVFLVICSSVTADPADEMILFRNTPWGITYEDSKELFDLIEPAYGWNETFASRFLGLSNSRSGKDHLGIYQFGALSNEKVAGYNISQIQLFYAYSVDQDGFRDTEKESAKLCIAGYVIDEKDTQTETIREDLKNKLSLRYGDVDDSNETEHYYVWYGAEGTKVSLWAQHSWGGSNRKIYINYSYTGCEELLDAAEKAIEYEFSVNIEGL